jgi:hypothetical protein
MDICYILNSLGFINIHVIKVKVACCPSHSLINR